MRKVIITSVLLALAAAAGAQTFSDDFNRANSGTLGSNWTLVSPTTQIINNAATNGSSSLGLSTVNGYSAAYTAVTVSADVQSGQSGTSYVALVFGYASTSAQQAIFIKIQDNDGNGTFDALGFYTGNNVNSGLSGFGSLSTPFSRAHIAVWASDANTVNLGVDTDFNGTFDQTYSSTGASSLALGTGVGLGLYGTAIADNYLAVVPEPATLLVFGLGALALRRRRQA